MSSEQGMPYASISQIQRWQEWVRKKIEYYISTGKWDNVTITQLKQWLANFDDNGKKYALALLNHFIYYSERDVKRLCHHALTRVVFSDYLLEFDHANNFCCSNESMWNELEKHISETRLVPLLSEGNPTESGNFIARVYTTTGLVKPNQILRPDQILPEIYRGSCTRFLFVDDFLGSGEQIDAFWNQPHIPIGSAGEKESLVNIASQHRNIRFEFVPLVTTGFGLQESREKAPNLRIHFCEQLTDEYRVFESNSIFFHSPDENKECANYLESLCSRKQIRVRGYRDLDFAVAFHHGTPDSCLPIFWMENNNWVRLFRRRM